MMREAASRPLLASRIRVSAFGTGNPTNGHGRGQRTPVTGKITTVYTMSYNVVGGGTLLPLEMSGFFHTVHIPNAGQETGFGRYSARENQ